MVMCHVWACASVLEILCVCAALGGHAHIPSRSPRQVSAGRWYIGSSVWWQLSLCVSLFPGDKVASHVISLFCLSAHTPVSWLSCSPWGRVALPKEGRCSRDKNKNAYSHAKSVRVYFACVCEFECLSVCPLSCSPPVFWDSCLQSSQLTVLWARKERHSLLFLYYPTQGHADIMNTSFRYLFAKWI